MKVSGFVRDVGSNSLSRLVGYQGQGILGNIYIQVEYNIPEVIARNLAALPTWKAALPGKVYYWLWGTQSPGDDAARIAKFRVQLGKPDGWLLNDEAPTFNDDRSLVYAACGDDPIVVSGAGYPQITPDDLRHMSQYGAKIEWQAGGPDGSNTIDPGDLVRESFEVSKVIQRDSAHPAVWWYRVYFDNLLGKGGKIIKRWAWLQCSGLTGGYALLREGASTWGTAAADVDGYGFTLSDRVVVNRKTGRKVGRVYGIARQKDIRVSISVERPISPSDLASLAASARSSAVPQREVSLYTLDNTSDAQFRAVAAL